MYIHHKDCRVLFKTQVCHAFDRELISKSLMILRLRQKM